MRLRPAEASPRRDPTRISVEPFTALTSLELRGCDLSTAHWDGLPLLQVCECSNAGLQVLQMVHAAIHCFHAISASIATWPVDHLRCQ